MSAYFIDKSNVIAVESRHETYSLKIQCYIRTDCFQLPTINMLGNIKKRLRLRTNFLMPLMTGFTYLLIRLIDYNRLFFCVDIPKIMETCSPCIYVCVTEWLLVCGCRYTALLLIISIAVVLVHLSFFVTCVMLSPVSCCHQSGPFPSSSGLHLESSRRLAAQNRKLQAILTEIGQGRSVPAQFRPVASKAWDRSRRQLCLLDMRERERVLMSNSCLCHHCDR